jgi:DDE superfamily endonuclease
LITLAESRSDWAVAFEDEVWWSRVAVPGCAAWTPAEAPLRLVEAAVPKGEPKALACYGLLVRGRPAGADGAAPPAPDDLWLRFVDGRPVSGITTQFLRWAADEAAARGLTTLLWIWDNASWHLSQEVRTAIRVHNQTAHRTGGVKIVPCWLPIKSPWLNPIEPKWTHGKRRVVEPARLLTADELERRVYAALAATPTAHLTLP